MQRIDAKLMREKLWDQTAYNMEIFFLSHGDYKSPQARRARRARCAALRCAVTNPCIGVALGCLFAARCSNAGAGRRAAHLGTISWWLHGLLSVPQAAPA